MQKLAGYSQIQSTGARVASATITVYQTGTLTPATIYADNLATPLSNPFTSDANGLWMFYAANGRYDVQMSSGSPTISPAYTLSDFLLSDSIQSSWSPVASAGLTVSGGTVMLAGSYIQIGKFVWFVITIAGSAGSTFSTTAFTSISLPLPVASTGPANASSSASVTDIRQLISSVALIVGGGGIFLPALGPFTSGDSSFSDVLVISGSYETT